MLVKRSLKTFFKRIYGLSKNEQEITKSIATTESLTAILYPQTFLAKYAALLFLTKTNYNKHIWIYLFKNDRRLFMAGAISKFFSWVIPTFLTLVLLVLLLKKDPLDVSNKLGDLTKQKKEKSVKFSDIIGIDEFKDELVQIVDFLKNRKQYLSAGATIPKGVLLSGPPGCGKTQLARAISSEAQVPFYAINASQLIDAYVGVSSKLIEGLFAAARKNKKGAIIFIDEIDTLETRSSTGGYTNSILNQLLTCMDGFTQSENIIIIAATNRPQVLDPALTRSGRFDLKIKIGLPYFENRVHIFDYYLAKVKKDSSIDARELAKLTVSFSPAEIKNLVNLGVLNAVKEGNLTASQTDMVTAFEKIKLGIRNASELSVEILERVALKESTKAVLCLHDPILPDIKKITINSFDNEHTGKGIYLDKIDATNYSKREFLSLIEFFLAGKAAESVFAKNEEITNIPNKDFERASSLAYRFVSELGFLEDFSLVTIEEKYLSGATKYKNEKKAEKVLNECYEMVKNKVVNVKREIELVKSVLLQKEQLTKAEIESIFKKEGIDFCKRE